MPPILEMQHITKRFPGVLALDDVNFSVNRGEIHSLIGQNGAGKSTLMKILAGDYPPSSGSILLDGKRVTFNNQRAAHQQGIALVHQELSLLPNLTVAENVFLGREPSRFLTIDNAQIIRKTRTILDQLGIKSVNPDHKIGQYPLAQQQLVEIAKAISCEPQILILDEPTAALSQDDSQRLFEILYRLKHQGIAIIYITHRFNEIIQNCDRGTILRNGRVIETVNIADTTEDELIQKMIGQEVDSFFRHNRKRVAPQVVLEVQNVCIDQQVKDVSFKLYRGEILGLTGLLGAGQNELARALFGLQSILSGFIKRDQQSVCIQSPIDAVRLGICLLTENRKEEGLFLHRSVKENITLPSIFKFLWHHLAPLINARQETQAAQSFVNQVNIILTSVNAKMRTLSGGNQQKAILARWLLRELDILIFIEPTRGVDMGAKAEIYRYLDRLAAEGRSIIVVSPELIEIMGIADRILAMYRGQIVAEFDAKNVTEQTLLAAIQGTITE
jgi:ribose transport system ATP-binding protein